MFSVSAHDPSAPAAADTCDGLSIGVEEEFLLIHPDTGASLPCAPGIIREAERGQVVLPGDGPCAELMPTMIEGKTAVCRSLEEVHQQLSAGRAQLAASAACAGAHLLPTGSPPLPGDSGRHVTNTEHYDEMQQLYGSLTVDQEMCACHVHVGVADRATAVGVINHVRPWLPALLSLSVNSPFLHGVDTGYASWRTVALSRWPTITVPPYFTRPGDYDHHLHALRRAGLLTDSSDTHWLVRLSAHLPTVEIRVADICATVDDAVLQAGLTRALVRSALRDLDTGRPAPQPSDRTMAAALWTAARHGLAGPALNPQNGERLPAVDHARRLLDHVADAADELGDYERINTLLASVLHHGTGAQRQRQAAASDGPRAVVRMLHQNGQREECRAVGVAGESSTTISATKGL